MKKLLAILLAVFLCFSLIACAGSSEKNDKKDETTTGSNEDPTKKPNSDNDSPNKKLITDLMVATGEAEYGVCGECGDEIDDDEICCDDCYDENVTGCIECEGELTKSEYLVCDNCFEETVEAFGGIESFKEYIESLSSGNMADIENADDEEYFDDEEDYPEFEPSNGVEVGLDEESCMSCGGPLDEDDAALCDDCKASTCYDCGTEIAYGDSYCEDCVVNQSCLICDGMLETDDFSICKDCYATMEG